MQYKVLSIFVSNLMSHNSVADAANKMEKMVNNAISEGWRPLGGVSVSHGEKTTSLSMAQAMIKE